MARDQQTHTEMAEAMHFQYLRVRSIGHLHSISDPLSQPCHQRAVLARGPQLLVGAALPHCQYVVLPLVAHYDLLVQLAGDALSESVSVGVQVLSKRQLLNHKE
jgi:hypothetical protein